MIKRLLTAGTAGLLLGGMALAGSSFRATNNLGGPVTLALYTNTAGLFTLASQQTAATNTAVTLTNSATYWQGVVLLNTNSGAALLTPFTVLTNAAANVSVLLGLGTHQLIQVAGYLAPGTNVASAGGFSSVVSTNVGGGAGFTSVSSTNVADGGGFLVTNSIYLSGAGVAGADGYYPGFVPPLYSPVTNLASGFVLTEAISTNSIPGFGNIHALYQLFTVSYGGTNYYTNLVIKSDLDSYVAITGWPFQSPGSTGWLALNTNNNPPPFSQYPAPSIPSTIGGGYNYSHIPSTNIFTH